MRIVKKVFIIYAAVFFMGCMGMDFAGRSIGARELRNSIERDKWSSFTGDALEDIGQGKEIPLAEEVTSADFSMIPSVCTYLRNAQDDPNMQAMKEKLLIFLKKLFGSCRSCLSCKSYKMSKIRIGLIKKKTGRAILESDIDYPGFELRE